MLPKAFHWHSFPSAASPIEPLLDGPSYDATFEWCVVPPGWLKVEGGEGCHDMLVELVLILVVYQVSIVVDLEVVVCQVVVIKKVDVVLKQGGLKLHM